MSYVMTALVCLRAYDHKYLYMFTSSCLLNVEAVLIGTINIGTTIMVPLEKL